MDRFIEKALNVNAEKIALELKYAEEITINDHSVYSDYIKVPISAKARHSLNMVS